MAKELDSSNCSADCDISLALVSYDRSMAKAGRFMLLFSFVCFLNVFGAFAASTQIRCPATEFFHTGKCVRSCPGDLIGDVKNGVCSSNPTTFYTNKSFVRRSGQEIVYATNATEYVAYLTRNTPIGTYLLTIGVVDKQGPRVWNYQIGSGVDCGGPSGVSQPFLIKAFSGEVVLNRKLVDNEYIACVQAYVPGKPISLKNRLTVTVMEMYAEITEDPQDAVSQLGLPMKFSCQYTIFEGNPHDFTAKWYIALSNSQQAFQLTSGEYFRGTMVNISSNDTVSTVTLDLPSVFLDESSIHCELSSDIVVDNYRARAATVVVKTAAPVIDPAILEVPPNIAHFTFNCYHMSIQMNKTSTIGWGMSKTPFNNVETETVDTESSFTADPPNIGFNNTKFTCHQNISGQTVKSNIGKLIIPPPPLPVSKLRVISVTTTSATVVWDKPFVFVTVPVKLYKYSFLPQDESGSCPNPSPNQLSDTNQLNFTVEGLKDGTTYCVLVAAVNIIGSGDVTPIQVTTEDMDECASDSTNSCSHNCTNTIGSFYCQCPEEYQLDSDNTTCLDIDECSLSSSLCNGTCNNFPGGYNCTCFKGFRLMNDNINCLDMDECASDSTNSCSHNCTNTIGSFYCQCPEGYQLGSDSTTCLDIDECSSSSSLCNGTCNNFPGGYNCTCFAGFQLMSDNIHCLDIDECATDSTNLCSHICTNTIGSFYCQCPEGYQLDSDNTTCLDIDECTAMTANCDHHCYNTDGGFRCSCQMFYELMQESFCRFVSNSSSVPTLDVHSKNGTNAQETLNNTISSVGILKLSRINTNASSQDIRNTVLAIVNYTDSILRFLSSGVKLSPEVEDRLTRGLIDILSKVLDPELLTSLDININGTSPVVTILQTVEKLGVFIASSNNTKDGATYQAANLDMALAKRKSSEEVAVDVGDLSATISAAEGTVFVAVSYGQLGSDIPVNHKNGDVESNMVSLQLVDKANGEAVQPKSSKSPYSVEMTFNDVVYSENVTCGFYVYGKNGVGDWSTEGLKTVNCSSYVCCKSSHLTNFAVLVNVGNVQHSPEIETALIALSYIGCGLSIICLFITVIALIVFRCKGQKTPLNFVHINLSVVLLTALVIFVGGSYSLRHYLIPCAIVTGLLHYLFLAVFSWMLCEGVMLYLMLVKVFSSMSKKLWFFMILGYGIPLVPVVVTAGVKHATYGNNSHGCWLNTELHHGTIWGFAAPVMAIMIINLVFLALAIAQLCKSQRNSAARKSSNKTVAISTLKATVILLPLLGLTWVFGFITFDVQSENLSGLEAIPLLFQIIFILLNSTQGVFIFIFYVLRNEKLVPYWRKFCITCCPCIKGKWDAYTSSKSKTDTVQLGTFVGMTSVVGKDELTKSPDQDEPFKDEDSITDVTVQITTLGTQSPSKSVVDVSEEQQVTLMLNDLDSEASDSTPDVEFSLGEPVITSSVGLSRTSPI